MTTKPISRKMYAVKNKTGFYTRFAKNRDYFKSILVPEDYEDSFEVKVTEDTEGNYYAFFDFSTKEFEYIYKTRDIVGMCFPYGISHEEELNEGIGMSVSIEEI